MIARFWRGWATSENADAYERVLRSEIIPSIEARNIPGLNDIHVMRRVGTVSDSGEVEFATIFWFASEDAIKGFVGEDVTRANMPDAARALLSRWDERVAHYDVREERVQG